MSSSAAEKSIERSSRPPAWLWLPFAYHAATRLPSNQNRISWAVLHWGGGGLAFALWANPGASIAAWVGWFFACAVMDLTYGSGYLENDVVVVEQEAEPTRRLPESLRLQVYQQLGSILWLRFTLAAVAIGAAAVFWRKPLLASPEGQSIGASELLAVIAGAVLLTLSVLATHFLFRVYNRSSRDQIRHAALLGLSWVRHFGAVAPLAFLHQRLLGLLAAGTILVALPRALEFSRKFRRTWRIGLWAAASPDLFRVVWLGSVLLLAGIATLVTFKSGHTGVAEEARRWVILGAYLFAWRFASWLYASRVGTGRLQRNRRYFE